MKHQVNFHMSRNRFRRWLTVSILIGAVAVASGCSRSGNVRWTSPAGNSPNASPQYSIDRMKHFCNQIERRVSRLHWHVSGQAPLVLFDEMGIMRDQVQCGRTEPPTPRRDTALYTVDFYIVPFQPNSGESVEEWVKRYRAEDAYKLNGPAVPDGSYPQDVLTIRDDTPSSLEDLTLRTFAFIRQYVVIITTGMSAGEKDPEKDAERCVKITKEMVLLSGELMSEP